MTLHISKKRIARARRHHRVRAKLFGTADVPRFSVFRSGKHIYAQLIDDVSGRTLLSLTSMKKGKTGKQKKTDAARALGVEFGSAVSKLGIKRVAFDRGGYAYHGRVQALAEGARESGLEF
ncbi:MAG: 50S ribosomal protein L18 [Patescibacteria group bacterium]|nr:50S ribosomal protein L18 [Patescibacteria group bacterium]